MDKSRLKLLNALGLSEIDLGMIEDSVIPYMTRFKDLYSGNPSYSLHVKYVTQVTSKRKITKPIHFSIKDLENSMKYYEVTDVKELPTYERVLYFYDKLGYNGGRSIDREVKDIESLNSKMKVKKQSVIINGEPYIVTRSFTDLYGNQHVFVRSQAGFFNGVKNVLKGTANFISGKKRNQSIIDNFKSKKTALGKAGSVTSGVWRASTGTLKRGLKVGGIAAGGALAVGGLATYGAAKVAKGVVKGAGSMVNSAASSIHNAVKSNPVPPPPPPVGAATQANPAAQPQSVTHHHHYNN